MKNRTRYIAAILGAVGIAVAVAGCGHGYRHHEPGDYAVRHIEKLGKELNLNEAQTAKLLERLTAPAATMEPASAVPAQGTPPGESSVDASKLDLLTKSTAAPPVQPSSATTRPVVSSPAPTAEDVAKTNDKLSSLLGGKK